MWDVEAHREMRRQVENLDVTKAEATSPDDKAMIDALVLKTLGSAEGASKLLRRAIISGFKAVAIAAFKAGASIDSASSDGNGGAAAGRCDGRRSSKNTNSFNVTGNRPLLDKHVVAVWKD